MAPGGDTIVAPATPPGLSAIAVIRLSGPDAIAITSKLFTGKDLSAAPGHTVHFGRLKEGDTLLDEVLVTLFRAPASYTGEDSVEISCHGSPLVTADIIKALVRTGARPAEAGEFTRRAFLNGKLDLAQAEAVADLIHAENENARRTALNQMKGGFSRELARLRDELIGFASLVELELDFSEEDVEFAERSRLRTTVARLLEHVRPLIDSFDRGNAIRNGVRTVIAGRPNAGKSTLLNALLNEEKAIVSEIAGTTRDVIEDVVHLEGITLRFLDTAGLRDTSDPVERIGVGRTIEQLKLASLVLYVIDLQTATAENIKEELEAIGRYGIPVIPVGNKSDLADRALMNAVDAMGFTVISARSGEHLQALKDRIVSMFRNLEVKQDETVITNVRHYTELVATRGALERVINGLDAGISSDLLAQDIRQALYHLGALTGSITTEDLLEQIFSKFCIGK